jgi:glycosyltransferase involved in cell wall biosynthesis
MAMRLPVVSTSHSGIPEAVENETTGLLVPPGDAAALARALERVLEDPDAARRMGASGRDAVIDRFDAEKNVRLLYDRFTLAEAIR